jgi:glycosyl transferase, family 25
VKRGAGVEIVYINLLNRPERNERFLRFNSGIADFRRTDAVIGASLQIQELIRAGVIAEPLTDYSSGALGNAVSHKRLWEECAAAKEMTIAEDDAIFNRHFASKAPQLLAGLPVDWDIILWGWNFNSVLHAGIFNAMKDVVMNFTHRPFGPRVSEWQAQDYPVQPLRLAGAFGIVCYSISPAGARRLQEMCFPLTNEPIPIPGLSRLLLNISLDATMNRHYHSLRAFACFPPLVWTENDRASSDVSTI